MKLIEKSSLCLQNKQEKLTSKKMITDFTMFTFNEKV